MQNHGKADVFYIYVSLDKMDENRNLIFSILVYVEICLSDKVNIHGDPLGNCLAK